MNNTRKRLIWLAAVLIWMGVIFYFSAQNGEQSSKLSDGMVAKVIQWFVPDFENREVSWQQSILQFGTLLVRKSAHFLEYAVLGVLLFNFVRTWNGRFRGLIAWGVAVIYAITDEWHQTFADGRTPKITDVAIDAAGACTGILVFLLVCAILKKISARKKRRQPAWTAEREDV